MTLTTITDLYSRYSDLCDAAGPVATRDQLRADYQAWCEAHSVTARYQETGAAYLEADDGPFEAETIKAWVVAQSEAAAAWAAEMLDPTSTPEHSNRWTAFEVGEYHSAGLGAVGATSADGRRLDALFAAAGGERALSAWLSARAEVAS